MILYINTRAPGPEGIMSDNLFGFQINGWPPKSIIASDGPTTIASLLFIGLGVIFLFGAPLLCYFFFGWGRPSLMRAIKLWA